MITLFQIDKSGGNVFEKDYSLVLVKNKEMIYGVNVPQNLKDNVIHAFNINQLGISDRLRLMIRFHASLAILLLEKAIKDEGFVEDVSIQLCNDIDGHFHEVQDMIYTNLSKIIPSLKREDVVQSKFPKNSLINLAAKNIRNRITAETKQYILIKPEVDQLKELIKR